MRLLRRDPFVDRLGGLGDRAADPTRGVVARDGQGPTLATLPGLGQRVRHQRQRTGLVGHFVHQQVHQTWLHHERRQPGRFLDRGVEVGLSHGGEQVQALLHGPREPGMGRDVGQPIGPERQDQRRRSLVLGQRAEKRVALRGVLAQREDLLALVDQQRRRRA